MAARTYMCIDLKSFYASVECVERGLDPMTTHLVVADPERGEGTICLAVSPSLKALGVKNRCRVFQIPRHLQYIKAEPRMRKYIDYAAEIYGIYLRYVAADDIHVYSIDEAFLDVTAYLKLYRKTPKEMAVMLMEAVRKEVGVRATCGIGPNLYLAKVALDIKAKHAPDFIAELDEESYRATLWHHRPLTDFWRVGGGTARRLEKFGITTMEQVARADADLLYATFGVDAELLIDHAYGREPTTIADIKAYRPQSHCITSGQVLMRDYGFTEAKLVFREMIDEICLELTGRELITSSLTIYVGYARRHEAAPARGSLTLPLATNAADIITAAAVDLFDKVVDSTKEVRRFNICCGDVSADTAPQQLSLFDDDFSAEHLARQGRLQHTVVDIKERFGKNTLLKARDLTEAATARERNLQIGGHKSGEKTCP